MKLIESAITPNSRRVRIFLAEKGIELETEQVDLGKLEHKTSEFADHNPMQLVPVLVMDDGSRLAESVAICRYFEELQPEPPLMGRDAREKAFVEMWQRRMELYFFFFVMHTFRHLHPHMAALEVPQVPEWGEANRPRVMKALDFIDSELADRSFIAGGDFTIADITAFIATELMSWARIERPAHLKNVARWYEAVSARPSASA